MQLASPAFPAGGTLPNQYTCNGKGISPPLVISGVPEDAKSLALIMHDPDAVNGKDFVHWTVWDMPPNTTIIAEGNLPPGAVQGTNDYPDIGYGPACPTSGSGVHHYVFDLYAVGSQLQLPEGADRAALEAALKGHTLLTTQMVGTVQA